MATAGSRAQLCEIDTLRHRSETGVIGVQMVPGVECGKETCRLPRIAYDLVEVNHRVKRALGELTQASDDLVGGHEFRRIARQRWHTDVIDALEDNQVSHPGLRQH